MSVMLSRCGSGSHAHGRNAEHENWVIGRARRFDDDIAPRFTDFHLRDASKHAPWYQDSSSTHDSFHGRLPKMDRMFSIVGRHAKNGNPRCPRRVVGIGFSPWDRSVIARSGRPSTGCGVRMLVRRRIPEMLKTRIGFLSGGAAYRRAGFDKQRTNKRTCARGHHGPVMRIIQ